MGELLVSLRASHDLVIVDTPPVARVADAIPLTKLVDGVIVVARLNVTTRAALSRLVDQLVNLRAPLLGAVINGSERDEQYGYYGAETTHEAHPMGASTS